MIARSPRSTRPDDLDVVESSRRPIQRRRLMFLGALLASAGIGAAWWRRHARQLDGTATKGALPIALDTDRDARSTSADMGLNAGAFSYWTGNKPFINIAHCTGSAWSNVPETVENRQGTELLSLPPNSRSLRYIILHNQLGESYVRPGRYVVTWEGPLQLRFGHLSELNDIRSQPNRIEARVNALTERNSGAIFLSLEAYNPTKTPQDLRALAIVHEEDLAAHAAGEWFAPSWLDQARAASVLRFMDWGGTNNSSVVRVGDFPAVHHTNWSTVPPRVIGAAGTKVGRDIWVCLPHKADAEATAFFFQEIAQTYPTGKVYVEYSNELWNWAFQQAHWLSKEADFARAGQRKAPPLAAGAAIGSLRAWSAAEAVFGRERVVRVFSGQSAWFDALSPAFDVSEPNLFGGLPLRELLDVYAIAPYFDLREGGEAIPADQGNRARIERKDHLQPNSYFLALAEHGIARAAANAVTSARRLKAIAPRARLVSYEAGTHEYISLDDYPTANQSALVARVDTGRNALVFERDVIDFFEDGEEAYVYWCGDQPLFVAGESWNARNTGWTPFKVRRLDSHSLRCYVDETSMKQDRPVQLLPSGSIPNDPARHYVGNFTRLASIAERIQTLMDGPTGAKLYDRYLQSLETAGLTLFMHYADSNNYGNLRRGSKKSFQFGLKRSHFEDDTGYSRAVWFKTLAKARLR